MQLKRQHSAEPLAANNADTRKTSKSTTPTTTNTPPANDVSTTPPSLAGMTHLDTNLERASDETVVGSPLKKQRASLPGLDDDVVRRRLGSGLAGAIGEILGAIDHGQSLNGSNVFGENMAKNQEPLEEEEL